METTNNGSNDELPAQIPQPPSALPPPASEGLEPPEASELDEASDRQFMILAIVVALVFIVGTVTAIVLLALPSTDTAKIRDIFIILLALLSMIIGLSLVVMMVQLARLINLMQNEVIPILEATEETVNTLRGTTAFLSENMVEPVIKLNEYLAALRSMLESLRIIRR